MSERVLKEFDDFMLNSYPDGCSQIQYDALKTAWFGGAFAYMCGLQDVYAARYDQEIKNRNVVKMATEVVEYLEREIK